MRTFNSLTDVMPLTYQLLESHGDGKIRIRGKFQQSGVKNGNGRIYPRSVLEREIQRNIDTISERGMVGELDHPVETDPSFSRASHVVTSLRMEEDGSVIGELEVLDGAYGRQLKSLIDAKVRLGISSRGMGTTTDDGYINEDYKLVTFDIVPNPSTVGAFGSVVESQSRERESKDMGNTGNLKMLSSLRSKVSEITRKEIRDMTVSERSSQILGIDSLLLRLGDFSTANPSLSSVVESLSQSLLERQNELTKQDLPTTPEVRAKVSESVIENITARWKKERSSAIAEKRKLARLLLKKEREALEVKEELSASYRVGERILKERDDLRRRYDVSLDVGEQVVEQTKKLLKKRKVEGSTKREKREIGDPGAELKKESKKLRGREDEDISLLPPNSQAITEFFLRQMGGD